MLQRRHLPRWRAGRIEVIVLNTLPTFDPKPYPCRTDPVRNFRLTVDAMRQEIEEMLQSLRLVLEPGDIAPAREEGKVGLMLGPTILPDRKPGRGSG